MKIKETIRQYLFSPADIIPLVVLRIFFGLGMIWQAFSLVNSGYSDFLTYKPFRFYYPGFEWVAPIQGFDYIWFYRAWIILALLITVGFFYRVSITLFSIIYWYLFFVEAIHFMNHYYFIGLCSLLLCFVPAASAFSLDCYLRKKDRFNLIPSWCIDIFKFQMGCVYFFGGIAKFNPDWLSGYPLRFWIEKKEFYFIRSLLPFDKIDTAIWMSWSGFLIDLLAVPLLLNKRTRLIFLIGISVFHLMNGQLFYIGIFPIFSILMTLLFFFPKKPIALIEPEVGIKEYQHKLSKNVILGFLTVYILFQSLFPLRRFLYEGNTAWTGDGGKFAWRMKISTKNSNLSFFYKNPNTGETKEFPTENFLKLFHRNVLSLSPELIVQWAHFIASHVEKNEGFVPEVYLKNAVSLNGRQFQEFIDSRVNLAKEEVNLLKPYPWVIPLYRDIREQISRGQKDENKEDLMNLE